MVWKRRVAQQHRRPQVISSALPENLAFEADPSMALAAKGAVNSCAELDSLFFGFWMCRTQAGQC
jgi:hypothetical protein